MDLSKLKEPFPESEIEWRVSRAGEKNGKVWAKILAYVTNRAIMNRLDEVCGPENWMNYLTEWQGNSAVRCGIAIRIGDEFITKWDVSENTDFEPVKGGVSGAGKRAAVQWGIGRYLYDLEETWANVSENGRYVGQYTDKKTGEVHHFRYDPPGLPAWALPEKAQNGKEEFLRSAKTADEFKARWEVLNREDRALLVEVKDEMKKKFGL